MKGLGKKIIKAAVLLLVFVASLVGYGMLAVRENVDLTSEMPEATLPIVFLQEGPYLVNELFGYKGEMEPQSIRDTITPLSEDMRVPVTIQASGAHVGAISYEVRTMDMERLLQNTRLEDFTEADGVISTELGIENLLEKGQEYRLILTLECDGEAVRYYTRLIRSDDAYVDEALRFVLDFHDSTFDPESAAQLAGYLEPSAEGDNTTLQRVTIHSSLSQVAWGEFKGEALSDPIPSIKEITPYYDTITLDYVLAAVGENGETEFYNVEEYYRIRYSEESRRMYLLGYERTMDQVFRGSGKHVSGNALELGIRDADVDYRTNEGATVTAFVQAGDLWSYDSSTNRLFLVYSFRGIEGMSDRENNGNHDIRIVRVGENGDIDFVVYGYMNRGTHEGHTGIGVYHYDSMANTVQESMFLQSREAYQVMKETWGQLFYVNADGSFYMLAQDTLYKITSGSAVALGSGFSEGRFAVSEDGRYVAWNESDNEMSVMDLDSEERWQVKGDYQSLVRPIGFVESDFVYGAARASDISEEDGFPMYKIVIMDKSGQVVKTYEKDGYYMMDAYVENATVCLERATRSDGIYVAAEPDAIKSREIEASLNIHVEAFVTEPKQTQVRLVLDQELSDKTPQVLTPQEVASEDVAIPAMEPPDMGDHYMVFDAGKVVLYTTNVAKAVQEADEMAGVVIGADGSYVWRRGRQAAVSREDQVILGEEDAQGIADAESRCIAALLQAEDISYDVAGLISGRDGTSSILKEAMPDAEILQLKGCSLSQALYYLDQGSLVFARGEAQEPLLIVGYDQYNTILYDPVANATYRKGMQDSEAYFSAGGNSFITYLRTSS